MRMARVVRFQPLAGNAREHGRPGSIRVADYTEAMARGLAGDGRRRLSRLFGWWYFCVGLGFILLGIRNWMVRAPRWSVALRFVIAAGFLILAFAVFRAERENRHGPGN